MLGTAIQVKSSRLLYKCRCVITLVPYPAVKGARLFASFFLEDVRRRELPIAGLFVE